MKYCKKCGAPLNENQKNCTKCGEPIKQQSKTPKNNKKLIMIIGIIAITFILLFTLYKIIESTISPMKEAKTISEDIKKGKHKNLSNSLVFNDRNLSKEESKAFYDYIVESDNPDRVANEIESNVKEMQKNNAEYTSIDINDSEVLHVEKNGKKFGIFNNYDFEVAKEKVSIYPDSDSTITYLYNDKKHKIKLSEENEKVFATLPIGNYKLKADKNIDDKKFEGHLIINMSDDNEVTEAFNAKYLDVSIDAEDIDDTSTIKFYVNDEEKLSYDEVNEYLFGPLLPNKKQEVYAQAEVDNKKFKSNVVKVPKMKDISDPINIDLVFDDNEIKERQENAEVKEEVQTFIEDYTDALNKAYEEEEYMYISSYIKSDSDTADHMEEVVTSGSEAEYSDPKVTKYNKDGNTVTIEVEKQDKNGKNIKSQYVLDYDDDISDFEIKSYTDI